MEALIDALKQIRDLGLDAQQCQEVAASALRALPASQSQETLSDLEGVDFDVAQQFVNMLKAIGSQAEVVLP